MNKEAKIVIGNVELNESQSMAVRVAIASTLLDLANNEYRHDLGEIAELYQARLVEVQRLIFTSIK